MVLFFSKSEDEPEETNYVIRIWKKKNSKPELFKEFGVVQQFVTEENAEAIANKISKAYGYYNTEVVEFD